MLLFGAKKLKRMLLHFYLKKTHTKGHKSRLFYRFSGILFQDIQKNYAPLWNAYEVGRNA